MRKIFKTVAASMAAMVLTFGTVMGNVTSVQAQEDDIIYLENDSLTAEANAGGTSYGEMVAAIYKDAYITKSGEQETLTLEFQDGKFTMHGMTFDVYALQTKAAGASGSMGDTALATNPEGLIALYTSDTEYVEPISIQTAGEKTGTISVFDRTTYTTTQKEVTFYPITSITFDITGLDLGTEFNVALYCEVFNSAMAAGMQFSNYVNPSSGVDYSATFSYRLSSEATGNDDASDATENGSEADTAGGNVTGTPEDPDQNAKEGSIEDIIADIVEETSVSTSQEVAQTTETVSATETKATGSSAVATAAASAEEVKVSTVTAGSYEIVIPTTIKVDADANSGAFQITGQSINLGENTGSIRITAPGSGNISSAMGTATYTNSLSGSSLATDGDAIDGEMVVSDTISEEDYYVTYDFKIGFVAE